MRKVRGRDLLDLLTLRDDVDVSDHESFWKTSRTRREGMKSANVVILLVGWEAKLFDLSGGPIGRGRSSATLLEW